MPIVIYGIVKNKRGQLLGNEGIAGSPMSASVPAGFKDCGYKIGLIGLM